MPAVTVDDITVLPRVKRPDPGLVAPRPVVSVTTAPSGHEGEGFPVRRAFAGVDAAAIDPFIMMDQMGEVEYAPYEPRGTDWHPHRGFETVTYIIDGTFIHSCRPWKRPPDTTSDSGGVSMCSRPLPAVIHCVSPLLIVPPPPWVSWWMNVPSMM